MKTLLSPLPALLLAASLAAQGGLTTATGYAVYARVGNLTSTTNVQGVPAGTGITGSGLQIRAFAGSSAGTIPVAMATTHTRIAPLSSSLGGRTVLVDEAGYAIPTPTRPAVAGTSDDPRMGGQAPHGLYWLVPAPAGTAGVVTVSWSASASIGAWQTAAVDVDADGTPEFVQRLANGNLQISRSFRVRAGNRGFTLGVVTNASAGANVSATTATGSRYDGQLRVALHVLPHCQFTNFGPECAGRLDGLLPSASGTVFALRLTNAAPRALAALAVGPRANLPIPLPGSRCQLLVDPILAVPGQTDAQGEETWTFPAIAVTPAIRISFQAVTLDLIGTPRIGSSNGTTLTCQ